MAEIIQADIAELVLDGQNPRHTLVDSTKACIAKLLEDYPNKLIELAKDVAEKGRLNPSQLPIVIYESGSKVVLDGNRRIAAVKLLNHPSLAPEQFIKRFTDIAKSAVSIPTKIDCLIVASREEARPWLKVIHLGENKGRGVVSWSPEQQQRFDMKPTSQAGIAVQLLDGIEALYRDDEELNLLVKEFRKARAMTTLGRLMQDPYVQDRLGLTFNSEGLLVSFFPEATIRVFKKILTDFLGENRKTARDINTKAERKRYIDGLGKTILPSDNERLDTPTSAMAAASGVPSAVVMKAGPSPKPSYKPIRHVFEGLKLQHASPKARDLAREAKTLLINGHVVTSAVLLRVLMEVVLREANDIGKWSKSDLSSQLEEAFKQVDPKRQSKNQYHERMKELDDAFRLTKKDGAYSLKSLHDFVHDWASHPTEEEVRKHSAALVPFLTALDEYIGKKKSL